LKMKQIRADKGISAAKLARIAEMHPSSISQIETHRLDPYPAQRTKIAAALGWKGDPADLFKEAE